MGYQETLEMAGCKIIDFEQFGSYQGTWLAFVEYEGEKGIVEGAYGSCSGCDAFEAEFGDSCEPSEHEGKYYSGWYKWEEDEITKEEYDELTETIRQKKIDFGKYYLSGGLYGKEHYQRKLESLKDDDWFDGEEKEYCQWAINQNWD